MLTEDDMPELELSVIVPARNEEGSLAACLQSLTSQSEPGFMLGQDWELIVVDDDSSDGTRAIAGEVSGVTLRRAPALDTGPQTGFTGKTNACWAGAQAARGRLLLFTDADTVFEPGSLSRARHESEKYKVAMLSYSPRQVTQGMAQRLLMPLVFAELAVAFPPARVNEPGDRTAAANGQFMMVQAEDYFAVGGHKAVGREVLEDVALASLFKRARRAIRLRYAPDALSTRMYGSPDAMLEGWTKNLALLFPNPLAMAATRTLVFALALSLPALALIYPFLTSLQRGLLWVVWLRGIWFFYARVAKSHFPVADCALSLLGLPLFIYLLVRSYIKVKVVHRVEWKGRSYSTKR